MANRGLRYCLISLQAAIGYWVILLISANSAWAHGSVYLEDDVCRIQIGFLDANFTGYQPETSGNKEFCDDIPRATRSIFILDFLHDFANEMEMDFRIINDATQLGIYATWEDIQALPDIEKETIYYSPPTKHSNGILKVDYDFAQTGNYIGIVTAKHPDKNKTYNAVFPFQVGETNFGFAPYVITTLLALQLFYWLNNREQKTISNNNF